MSISLFIRFQFLLLLALAIVPEGAFAQRPQGIHALTILHDDGTVTVSTRKPHDRLLEQFTYDVDGILRMKRLFALDRIGQVKSGVVFDGGGNLVFTISYKFDEFDRLSEEHVLDKKGKLVRFQITEYDELGKPKTKVINNPKMENQGAVDESLYQHPDQVESSGRQLQGDQRKSLQRSNGSSSR